MSTEMFGLAKLSPQSGLWIELKSSKVDLNERRMLLRGEDGCCSGQISIYILCERKGTMPDGGNAI